MFQRAIERLEIEESQFHEFGLNDDEFKALRKVLRCRVTDWFDNTMAAHPRIVALGFALAMSSNGKLPVRD